MYEKTYMVKWHQLKCVTAISRHFLLKVHEMQEIKLEKRKGYPFYMAFAYPPDGPVLYTGDLGVIRKHCQDMPTHHAWITSYLGGKKVHGPRIILFGKNSYFPRKETYLDLFRSERTTMFRENFFCGRPTFVLLSTKEGNRCEIRRYRKVPNKYLRELEACDLRFSS